MTTSQRIDLARFSPCPTFLIGLAGPSLSIGGAVWPVQATVEYLTDVIWLGVSPTLTDARVVRIARIFLALRNGIRSLTNFYARLDCSKTDLTARERRVYPYPTSYPGADSTPVEFIYTGRLQDRLQCVTFKAKLRTSNKDVVVKFVTGYGENAHRLLADHGFAPELLYYGPLIRNGELYMVVMDFIDGENLADAFDQVHILSGIHAEIKKAVKLLHAQDLVFGDLRRANVMLRKGWDDDNDDDDNAEGKVVLVDFDWAGQRGVARYPMFVSPHRPDGVRPHALVQPEHDLEMLEILR